MHRFEIDIEQVFDVATKIFKHIDVVTQNDYTTLPYINDPCFLNFLRLRKEFDANDYDAAANTIAKIIYDPETATEIFANPLYRNLLKAHLFNVFIETTHPIFVKLRNKFYDQYKEEKEFFNKYFQMKFTRYEEEQEVIAKAAIELETIEEYFESNKEIAQDPTVVFLFPDITDTLSRYVATLLLQFRCHRYQQAERYFQKLHTYMSEHQITPEEHTEILLPEILDLGTNILKSYSLIKHLIPPNELIENSGLISINNESHNLFATKERMLWHKAGCYEIDQVNSLHFLDIKTFHHTETGVINRSGVIRIHTHTNKTIEWIGEPDSMHSVRIMLNKRLNIKPTSKRLTKAIAQAHERRNAPHIRDALSKKYLQALAQSPSGNIDYDEKARVYLQTKFGHAPDHVLNNPAYLYYAKTILYHSRINELEKARDPTSEQLQETISLYTRENTALKKHIELMDQNPEWDDLRYCHRLGLYPGAKTTLLKRIANNETRVSELNERACIVANLENTILQLLHQHQQLGQHLTSIQITDAIRQTFVSVDRTEILEKLRALVNQGKIQRTRSRLTIRYGIFPLVNTRVVAS
jgi:hypothetical protein